MNREDIIRMAREAGMDAPREIVVNNYWTADYDDIERFAALIAAAEREACAKICDAEARDRYHMEVWGDDFANHLAAAIRARG